MTTPTITQQRALAYAEKPFAILSLFASVGMIYHIRLQQPEKRKRLYHRLILAMNISIFFQSANEFWGNWAVPEGTPNYAGASGTDETCKTQGFLAIMLSLTVPVYYASLSMYSFLAIKNRFQEEKYQWIEKWIHTVALCLPLLFSAIMAVKDNIQPAGSGCFIGNKIKIVTFVFGFGQLFIYFFMPATAMILVWRLIKTAERKMKLAKGMKQIIEAARKRLLRDASIQICLYLFSFWSTYILSVAQVLVFLIEGRNYNLTIVANCLYLSQGFVMMIVYVLLQKMSRPKDEFYAPSNNPKGDIHAKKHKTVSQIRKSAATFDSSDRRDAADTVSMTCAFTIFDGTPSADSPWAKYIDQDYDDECDVSATGEPSLFDNADIEASASSHSEHL